MPTPRHAEAPAAGARHVAEPTPLLEPAPHQASRPQFEQRSAPMRHLVEPTAQRPAIGPHVAGSAVPTRHLMMTAHPAFRAQPQPHSASPKGCRTRPRRSARFDAEARRRCSNSDLIWISCDSYYLGCHPAYDPRRAQSLWRCSHCRHPARCERRPKIPTVAGNTLWAP